MVVWVPGSPPSGQRATIGTMGTVLLVLVVVLVIAGLVYGVVTLLAGEDPGLSPADPDGRARPLPNNRSLSEYDLKTVRFDVGFRGYRMTQVDRVLRRTAYDIGYKDEMIAVLEAEVIALREGRAEDAELLRKARESAANPGTSPVREHDAPVLDLDEHEHGPEADDEPPAAYSPSHSAQPSEEPEPDPEPEPEPDPEPREGSLLRRPDPGPPAVNEPESVHVEQAEAAGVNETQPSPHA
jgi:DivIVA domain-containing protein